METMQILTTLFIVLWSLSVVVKGKPVLRVLLNNGQPMVTEEEEDACNDEEWDLIETTIATFARNQRRSLLRDNENTHVNHENNEDNRDNHDGQRDLQTYSSYCRTKCQGFPYKYCLAVACKAYRRERTTFRGLLGSTVTSKKADEKSDADRELYYATSCSNQMSEMKNWLNNLAYQVSDNCATALRAPRKMTCFDDSLC